MPVDAIETDLENGSLVKIAIEDIPDANLGMVMSAVFRTDRPPGPAGRWLIEHLKSSTATRARPVKSKRAR
jgi:DNA-binding transcriptional LysR family regulator